MDKNQELTREEIEKIFDFVRSKNVPYKDVQYEIVDHFACEIEDLLSREPGVPFNTILSRTYAKFPITGFAELQVEKEKYIKSYWKKKFGLFMLKFFQIPRIIFTTSLFLVFYYLFKQFGLVPMWIFGFTWCILFAFSYYKSRWCVKIQENYLIVKSFVNSIVFFFYNVWFAIVIISFQGTEDLYIYSTGFANAANVVIALLFSLAWIFAIASFNVFPNMLKEEIDRKYQHLQLIIDEY